MVERALERGLRRFKRHVGGLTLRAEIPHVGIHATKIVAKVQLSVSIPATAECEYSAECCCSAECEYSAGGRAAAEVTCRWKADAGGTCEFTNCAAEVAEATDSWRPAAQLSTLTASLQHPRGG